MKILVVGAEGFVGRNVTHELENAHDVFKGVRKKIHDSDHAVPIDLSDKDSVKTALVQIKPNVIVNCAGIVDSNADVSLNALFTRNILESIVEESLDVDKVVLSGSAGQYGLVQPEDLPVSEESPLAATSEYGLSKIEEVEYAKKFASVHSLNVVEARIFNPLGPGMHDRFLLTRILKQAQEVKSGSRQRIEINRLDAARDYIDVRDVAKAIRAIIEKPTHYHEYNIGTGKPTTNKELIDHVVRLAGLNHDVEVAELSDTPEAFVASEADISRISKDIGWKPKIDIRETIKNIVGDDKSDEQ